jgi:hypothetical protein
MDRRAIGRTAGYGTHQFSASYKPQGKETKKKVWLERARERDSDSTAGCCFIVQRTTWTGQNGVRMIRTNRVFVGDVSQDILAREGLIEGGSGRFRPLRLFGSVVRS